MAAFTDLTNYEKGVVARHLLSDLIKQGRFGEPEGVGVDTEIIIQVKQWQLQLLGCFVKDSERTNAKRGKSKEGCSKPKRRTPRKGPVSWLPWGAPVFQ